MQASDLKFKIGDIVILSPLAEGPDGPHWKKWGEKYELVTGIVTMLGKGSVSVWWQNGQVSWHGVAYLDHAFGHTSQSQHAPGAKLDDNEKRFIVGIAGPARSGKDTLAQFFVEHGYKRFAFADELKNIVCDMFGWNDRHKDGELKDAVDARWGFSPRRAYQLFGTEFGRALDKDLWVKKADKALCGHKYVIADVRFENEAAFVRNNGVLIHISRPGAETVEAHASENGVSKHPGDIVVTNDGTVAEMCAEAAMQIANATCEKQTSAESNKAVSD